MAIVLCVDVGATAATPPRHKRESWRQVKRRREAGESTSRRGRPPLPIGEKQTLQERCRLNRECMRRLRQKRAGLLALLPLDILLRIVLQAASPWLEARVVHSMRAKPLSHSKSALNGLFFLCHAMPKNWGAKVRMEHSKQIKAYIDRQTKLDAHNARLAGLIQSNAQRAQLHGALVWGAPLAHGQPLAEDYEMYVVLQAPTHLREQAEFRVGRVTEHGVTNSNIGAESFRKDFMVLLEPGSSVDELDPQLHNIDIARTLLGHFSKYIKGRQTGRTRSSICS